MGGRGVEGGDRRLAVGEAEVVLQEEGRAWLGVGELDGFGYLKVSGDGYVMFFLLSGL